MPYCRLELELRRRVVLPVIIDQSFAGVGGAFSDHAGICPLIHPPRKSFRLVSISISVDSNRARASRAPNCTGVYCIGFAVQGALILYEGP